MIVVRFLILLSFLTLVFNKVVINEVMYNSPIGGKHEYVELYNSDAAPADVGGWSIEAIKWKFPAGTTIPGDTYVVIARKKERLLIYYEFLQARVGLVFGDFAGNLQSGGERLDLKDGSGNVVDSFRYNDRFPYSALPDGLGSSLQRMCADAPTQNAGNWMPSTPVQHADYRQEFSGTPTLPNTWTQCPPFPYTTISQVGLHVSEVMYNAVDEPMMRDQYEFVELINRAPTALDISHYLLHGETLRYRFPADTSLEPGARIVVAANPDALKAAYAEHGGTDGSPVLGPFTGSLSNGGDKIVIVDNNGREVEAVRYDDKFPWPLAADRLGSSDSWLEPDHFFKGKRGQFATRGYSLQRVDYDGPDTATTAFAWQAAPATPTRDMAAADRFDASNHTIYAPTLQEIDTKSAGSNRPLAGKAVTVRARLEPFPSKVEVLGANMYWYEVVKRGQYHHVNEHSSRMQNAKKETMKKDTNGAWLVTIPGFLSSSVVRYRFEFTLAGGKVSKSPRETDPEQWHAFFVPPPPEDADSPIFRMFIRGDDWARLISNTRVTRIIPGKCNFNPLWNEPVPVVFVHDDEVIFARTRYQGSRFNRNNGESLANIYQEWVSKTIGPTDIAPGDFKVRSWRLKLPPWASIGGRRELIFNKLWHKCLFYSAPLHFKMAKQLGLYGHKTEGVRFHINGRYWRYMLYIDRPGDDAVEEWLADLNDDCPTKPTFSVGHLFKAQGYNGDEGPYGHGTLIPLKPHCGYTPEERYEWTYGRKTHFGKADNGQHKNFIAMLNQMNGLDLSEAGFASCKAWYEKNTDVNLMLNYIALQNWAGIWDDNIHNWFTHQRVEDGRFVWAPWDADELHGEMTLAEDAHIFEGMYKQQVQAVSVGKNVMKNSFITCFRQELVERNALLQQTVFSVDNTDEILSDIIKDVSTADFNADFGQHSSTPPQCASDIAAYLVARPPAINTMLQTAAITYSVTVPSEEEAKQKAAELSFCPNIPDIPQRLYNTYRAPSDIALAAPRSEQLGEIALAWLEANPLEFSPTRRKRAQTTHIIPQNQNNNNNTANSNHNNNNNDNNNNNNNNDNNNNNNNNNNNIVASTQRPASTQHLHKRQEPSIHETFDTFPANATVATQAPMTVGAVVDADKKTTFPDDAEFELQRGELSANAQDLFAMPTFDTIYSGPDRQFVDKNVTPGVYYAYRVRFNGGDYSPMQIGRGLTQAELARAKKTEAPVGVSSPTDLTVVWIVLGALGGVLLLVGLIVGGYVLYRRRNPPYYVPKSHGAPAGGASLVPLDVARPGQAPNHFSPPGTLQSNTTFGAAPTTGFSGNSFKSAHGNTLSGSTFNPATVQTVTSLSDVGGPIGVYNAGAPSAPGGLGGQETCEVCGNRYPTRDDVEIHKRKRHPDDPRTIWPTGKPAVIVTSNVAHQGGTFQAHGGGPLPSPGMSPRGALPQPIAPGASPGLPPPLSSVASLPRMPTVPRPLASQPSMPGAPRPQIGASQPSLRSLPSPGAHNNNNNNGWGQPAEQHSLQNFGAPQQQQGWNQQQNQQQGWGQQQNQGYDPNGWNNNI